MITTMTTRSDDPISRVEVITSVQRRRRWSAAEKVRLVEEAMQPGMSVSFVARRAGIAPSQLFAWKRMAATGWRSLGGACLLEAPAYWRRLPIGGACLLDAPAYWMRLPSPP